MRSHSKDSERAMMRGLYRIARQAEKQFETLSRSLCRSADEQSADGRLYYRDRALECRELRRRYRFLIESG